MDLDNSNNTNRKDKYNLVWENLKSKEYKNGNCPANARFNNLIPFIAFSNKDYSNKDEVYVESLQNIRRNLIMCSEMLGSMFSSFNYIGPLREEPSRRYIYEDEIIEIGLKGENAAYICQNEGDVHLYNCYFFNAVSNSFYKIDDITLMYALKNWLENMDISGFETEPSNEIVYLNMQSSTSKDTKVNIADVGFGVSQILPILLEGLRMPENNTLILEQPEIHLHPKLQMQMADYFISLALSNKNIIVETHSDHIVNRLVRRVIEDETKNLNDLIAIYFISATDKGSSCEKIEIDDRNGIVNWPEGFFDQTANEQEKIIKAGLTKRMKKIVN